MFHAVGGVTAIGVGLVAGPSMLHIHQLGPPQPSLKQKQAALNMPNIHSFFQPPTQQDNDLQPP